MMLVVGMTACGSSDSTGTADSGTANGTDVKNWYYSISRTRFTGYGQKKVLLMVWQRLDM